INVDETTYMFSPKVLDRANVIEFRVTNNEMDSFLSSFNKIDKNAANGLGAHLAASFVRIAQRTIEEETADTLKKELAKFFNKLKIVSAEFGYRTATEIKRFYAIASSLETKWDDDNIMDKIIIQKLLPKLHGSRKKIVPVLEALWELCQKQSDDITKLDSEFSYDDFDSICKYPLSGEKIWRMYKNACENGFTSFAEA
ncbi:MAG: hypothetical protein LUG98_09040, partial [Tannerellaceae bacterium]|nr:hypothetical protein [Tannerellaceae bacterium]